MRGAYGKQSLLETIYTVYVGWWNGGDAAGIRVELVRRLADETIPADAHLLELLIRVSLPDVELNVVRTWVDAIRYAEDRHVRSFKLRGFLWVKGGLVRCARLYREAQEKRLKEAEIDRLNAEDREAGIKQARRARRRRRAQVSMPVGMRSLYD